VRWKMEHPVGLYRVLPRTRLAEIPDDSDRTSTPDALRRVQCGRETRHSVSPAHENFDKFDTEESGCSRHERRRPYVACHVLQCADRRGYGPPTAPARSPYGTRTSEQR
jgi:hypothetical protein